MKARTASYGTPVIVKPRRRDFTDFTDCCFRRFFSTGEAMPYVKPGNMKEHKVLLYQKSLSDYWNPDPKN
jgi:hypothetical protein